MKTKITREVLLKRLSDIEWDDFEVKEAKDKLPENVWDCDNPYVARPDGVGVED